MHFLSFTWLKSDQKLLLISLALLLFHTKWETNKAAHVSPSPHGCGCQEHNISFLPFSKAKPWPFCVERLSYNNNPRKCIFFSLPFPHLKVHTTGSMGPIPDSLFVWGLLEGVGVFVLFWLVGCFFPPPGRKPKSCLERCPSLDGSSWAGDRAAHPHSSKVANVLSFVRK